MDDVYIPPKPPKAVIRKHDGAQACDEARSRRNPIIVVPGLGRSSISSMSLRNRLQQLEYEVYLLPLPYYGLGDAVKTAHYLGMKLDEFKILLSTSHLDVICQGGSGLVMRYCLEKLGRSRYLERVVFLGTMMRGTYRLFYLPLLKTPRQVMPVSSFMRELNSAEPAPDLASKYVSIYSRYGSFLIPGGSGFLRGIRNIKVKWLCSNPDLSRSRRVLTLLLDVLQQRRETGEEATRDSAGMRQLQEADQAVQEHPEDANALVVRGRFYLERGCWDLAVHDLNAAIRLKPDLSEAYFLRAMAMRRKIRYDENPIHNRSILDLSRTIRLKPGYAEAYYERGVCHALLNVWDEAIEDWDHALILNRDYHAAYLARGLALSKMGNHRGALEDFKEVLRLHPDNQDAVRMISELEPGR